MIKLKLLNFIKLNFGQVLLEMGLKMNREIASV